MGIFWMQKEKIQNYCVSDYAPFGALLAERSFSSENYPNSFNDKRDDPELGDWQDYGMRMYSTWQRRFPTPDPLIVYGQEYPELSTYQFASNSPIMNIDLDGLEAWNKTREWEHSDRRDFANYTKMEIQRINDRAILGEVNSYTCYDCADLVVSLYVRYAFENGLEVEFTSNRGNKKIMNSSDAELVNFNPENPKESMGKYLNMVRNYTSASSLAAYDLVEINKKEAMAGDLLNDKSHVFMIRLPDEKEKPLQVGQLYLISGTINSDNPMNGVLLIKEDREFVGSVSGYKFSRFKELNNVKKDEYNKVSTRPMQSIPIENL